MYIYFNSLKQLSTSIPHGQTIRQGDAFDLYVLFDKGYVEQENIATLFLSFQRKSDSSPTLFYKAVQVNGDDFYSEIFQKEYDGEATFGLLEGVEYDVFHFSLDNSLTSDYGELKIGFSRDAVNIPSLDNSLFFSTVSLNVEENISAYTGEVPVSADEYAILINLVRHLTGVDPFYFVDVYSTQTITGPKIITVDSEDHDALFLSSANTNHLNVSNKYIFNDEQLKVITSINVNDLATINSQGHGIFTNLYGNEIFENNVSLSSKYQTKQEALDDKNELDGRISDIESYIPSGTGINNKLINQEILSTAISQSLGTNRGTFQTYADLIAESFPTLQNNDYATVIYDETHNNETWRYSYSSDSDSWVASVRIASAPLTPQQQAAVDSGITSSLVNKIGKTRILTVAPTSASQESGYSEIVVLPASQESTTTRYNGYIYFFTEGE